MSLWLSRITYLLLVDIALVFFTLEQSLSPSSFFMTLTFGTIQVSCFVECFHLFVCLFVDVYSDLALVMPSCMNNAKWCCVLSESVRRHRILVGEFLFLILRRFSSFLHLKCYFLIPFSNWITTVRRLFKIVQLSWSPKELPSSGFSIICSFWIPFPLRSRNFSKKLQPSLSSHTAWPGLLQPHRLPSAVRNPAFSPWPPLPSPLSSSRVLAGK